MGLNEPKRNVEKRRRQRARVLKWIAIPASATALLLVVVVWVLTLLAPSKEDLFASGKEYAAGRMYAEAALEYRKAIALDGSYGEARYELARTHMALGQTRQAMAEAIRAADLMPGHVQAQLEAIRFLIVARQFEDALVRADALLKVAPKNIEALIAKAGATARLVDVANGIFEIEDAIRLTPADPRGYMMLATLHSQSRDLTAAEAAFTKAVEVAPASEEAVRALAVFYWRTGRLADAEMWLRKAVDLEPSSLDPQRRLASFLVATGRAAEAEAPLKLMAAQAPSNVGAQFALADYYILQQRRDDARPMLEQLASREGPGQVPAKLRLARIHYVEGRTAEVQRLLGEVLTADRRNSDALVMRAELLLAEGNATEALQIAEEALSIQPRLSYAKRIVAEAHVAQVELEPAVRALTELLQANPRDLAAMVRLAQLELQRRNIPRAAQIAEEAVVEEPNGVTPRIVRAQVNIAKGAFDDASADLTLLNRNVSDIPLVHALIGDVALRRRQFADARRSFDRVMALDPNSIEAIRGLTTLEILEGRPQRAVAMIEQRLKRVPDDRELAMVAASVYVLVGDGVKAEQALLQVASREPNYQAAHVDLANLYVEQNRLDLARQRLALVTKGDAAIGAQAMLGMILQQENKPEEAIGVFEKVVAMAPEHALAANNLAWLYADAGERLNVALQLAQTATRLEPANALFHDTLGWVHLKRDAGDLAVTAFSESVKLAGSDPYYRYHLAMAYAKIGDSKKATAELRRVLALRPDYKDAQLLLESLPKS